MYGVKAHRVHVLQDLLQRHKMLSDRHWGLWQSGKSGSVTMLLLAWSAFLIVFPARTVAQTSHNPAKPNVLFILADDLGWADVSWHNSLIPMPNLDRLAHQGMILNQSYVQPTCSPSRGALMSGRYAYHIGLQYDTISDGQPLWLLNDQPILPQALKSLGYATHMVGKWHLGFCNWRYTPTYRGFDSFYGYYSAAEDYFQHSAHTGYDFRDDTEVDKTVIGHYSTNLFADRAIRIINQHNFSQPLFLYLAFQAVHGPLQVPQTYISQHCTHIQDHDRQIKCGMIAALDEAVANVTDALRHRGVMDNTFVIFSSDNGGPVNEASSNWPLRGSKITIWEGGTRASGFVYAPGLLQRTNFTYDELFHISDWYPTLVEAAGGSPVQHIDGVSQWQNLLNGGHGPRQEILYNIDEIRNDSAIRNSRFKLIQGFPRSPDGWYASPELEAAGLGTTQEVHGGAAHAPAYQMYDLQLDPEEKHDVLSSHPDEFQQLKARLEELRKTIVPTKDPPRDPSSNPRFFEGNWSPGWCP